VAWGRPKDETRTYSDLPTLSAVLPTAVERGRLEATGGNRRSLTSIIHRRPSVTPDPGFALEALQTERTARGRRFPGPQLPMALSYVGHQFRLSIETEDTCLRLDRDLAACSNISITLGRGNASCYSDRRPRRGPR
jgi:hypothetical protein